MHSYIFRFGWSLNTLPLHIQQQAGIIFQMTENLTRLDIKQPFWDMKFGWGVGGWKFSFKNHNTEFGYILILYSWPLPARYSISWAKGLDETGSSSSAKHWKQRRPHPHSWNSSAVMKLFFLNARAMRWPRGYQTTELSLKKLIRRRKNFSKNCNNNLSSNSQECYENTQKVSQKKKMSLLPQASKSLEYTSWEQKPSLDYVFIPWCLA